ncbi:SDR family NAD(P)-dependent oxidoreductase [Mesorhizobium australicum]|uniref:NAD(P)-dependent dehydrogenase, short-chain alcohol dehydrogenase family n=1 Tax=Mesorhizobium australicum TaxID=536018 RepID=A0A1X7N0S9_9HYPH|nr:glucose 1-dehydrogenase [Mesorhizobium australicum]SMH30869.1 NAD(P)-dependent dehydrogenase, short-chain alcohol dehydrogenase family [Mesorhizobium australicum]
MPETTKPGRVDGKVAVVTGAANGIGAACARLLASEGARVVLADLDEAGSQQQLQEIEQAGGTGLAIRLDTTSEAEWRRAMEKVAERFGHLDIAVNCAGVSIPRIYPTELSLEDWRAVMAVNLDGVFLGTKHALALMERNDPAQGSIINIASVMGMVGLADVSPYNASKGGVRLMTKSVALSCAQKGVAVRVNSVCPGFTDTPMVQRSFARSSDPDDLRRKYDALQPVGHMGVPDDIAWGVLYLASDESRFVTGADLVIDGGFTAR